MRGGAVQHKAHLAPASRYSEDIDRVLVKAMDTDTLDQHLRISIQIVTVRSWPNCRRSSLCR